MAKIGEYETVRLLGKGGMSEVYEAENPRIGSRHAIKLFTYEKDDPDVRARFLTEGRLLAKLNHPRIVKVTDFGTDGATGRPYFVMDLVLDERGQARSLLDVQPGTADEEEIGRWYDDLRDGLAYIHANGVIHRDLKLQNVMIGPDGHAVLTDFGISKIFDAGNRGKTIVDTVQTIVKMKEGRSLVMGSLGYMAPEIEMGVEASPASDWYALGVIVYRLLTGQWCDARTDVVGALAGYDPAWKRILPKLLHSNPAGRECLSFADEKRADRERAELAAEERWLREKGRGHFARHFARWLGAVVILLAVGLGVQTWRHAGTVRRLRENFAAQGPECAFDRLFAVPAEAGEEEKRGPAGKDGEEGALLMPARDDLEAARIDLMVITHDDFAALAAKKLTVEKFVLRMKEILRSFESEISPDADGGSEMDVQDYYPDDYQPLGQEETIVWMLDQALETLENGLD